MRQEFFSLSELLHFTAANPHSNTKAFCRLGCLPLPVARLVAQVLRTKELFFELIIDSDAIRHTIAQHGSARSQLEALRGQLPIQEADFSAPAGWLPNILGAAPGQTKPGKQPRVEVSLLTNTEITTAILEWRPGRKQLALVTIYKKRPAA